MRTEIEHLKDGFLQTFCGRKEATPGWLLAIIWECSFSAYVAILWHALANKSYLWLKWGKEESEAVRSCMKYNRWHHSTVSSCRSNSQEIEIKVLKKYFNRADLDFSELNKDLSVNLGRAGSSLVKLHMLFPDNEWLRRGFLTGEKMSNGSSEEWNHRIFKTFLKKPVKVSGNDPNFPERW